MSIRKAVTGVLSMTFVVAFVASAALAGPSNDGAFAWTTDSAEAKELITELMARVENFQFGTDTAALAERLVVADPQFAMGVYYLSAVSPSDAQKNLERAVALSENASDGEKRFIAAMATARANGGANFQDAIPLLEALADDYPNERLVPMLLGQMYQGTGDAAKARAAFEKALAIGPPSNRARSFLANDDLLHDKYEQARASFESIEKQLPEGAAPAVIRYGVAFSYLYQGSDAKAIQALEAYLEEYRATGAAQSFPEVFIWNSIARIHLENGRTEQAMAAYEKGYESVPDSGLPEDQKTVWYGRLKHGRCRTLAKMGRHDEAWEGAEELRQVIEQGGEDGVQYLPAYHYLAGYLMLEAGEVDKAVAHLEQANPNDPFHNLLLARALALSGDQERSRKTYQQIVESQANGLERALAYPEAKQELSKS